MNKSNKLKNILYFIIICAVLVLLDQITKVIFSNCLKDGNINIIPNFFYLELVWNSGAAFGILKDSRILFCVLTILICLVIEFYYFRIPRTKEYTLLRIDFIFLFSGALGNLIDRIKRGTVIDFLAFDFGSYSFPRFNVADIYITVSAIALFVLILFYYKDEQLAVVFSRNKKKGQ